MLKIEEDIEADLTNASTYQPAHPEIIKMPVIDDDQMLLYAVSQAGRWAYGVMAIEVWTLNSKGRLSCPKGGNWIDRVYLKNSDPKIERALIDVQAEHYDYSHSNKTIAVTEGLPGYMWTKSSRTSKKIVQSTLSNLTNSMMIPRRESVADAANLTPVGVKTTDDLVVWSDVGPIVNDPDQPYSWHAKSMYHAGFGVCGGIPFHFRGCEGIVMLYARGTVDRDRLTNVLNEEYLLCAAEQIGSIMSVRKPREVSRLHRKREKHLAFDRARDILANLYYTKMKNKDAVNIAQDAMLSLYTKKKEIWKEIEQNSESKKDPNGFKKMSDNLQTHKNNASCCDPGVVGATAKYVWTYWSHKMLGGGVDIKGPKPLSFAAYMVVSVFVTYMIMSYINKAIGDTMDNNYVNFQMGVTGSLMTVVYGLMEAPASQPRNIILGQGGCMFIAILCSLIPGDDPDLKILRVSLSVALGAGYMATTGLLHPPGTSVAVIFSGFFDKGSKLSGQSIGFLFLSNAILVVVASVVNNLSYKRSYPLYWGYLPSFLNKQLQSFLGNTSKPKKS